MSSRTLRRVLAVTLVAASLSLTAPVSAEAADLFTSPEEPSFWALAWQWLTEQMAETTDSALPLGAAEADDHRTDAGWIIDPDG